MRGRVAHRKLHRFDLLVHRIGTIALAELEPLQNLQRHEHRNAVTVGRQLPTS